MRIVRYVEYKVFFFFDWRPFVERHCELSFSLGLLLGGRFHSNAARWRIIIRELRCSIASWEAAAGTDSLGRRFAFSASVLFAMYTLRGAHPCSVSCDRCLHPTQELEPTARPARSTSDLDNISNLLVALVTAVAEGNDGPLVLTQCCFGKPTCLFTELRTAPNTIRSREALGHLDASVFRHCPYRL